MAAESRSDRRAVRRSHPAPATADTTSPRTEAATQGFPGDIFVLSSDELGEFSAVHPLIDLRPFIDEATMLDDYGSYLVSLSRIGDNGEWPSDTGAIHGVPVDLSSKSLIWTNEPEFTDLGYKAPSDWATFMDLANEMVADGQTPFCLGIESGVADGWPATDWVEAVVLRTGGPDFYDQWITHEVPFDDPVVVNAIRTVGEMVLTPGFLDTTPAQAAIRPWEFALQDFLDKPGSCLMIAVPQLPAGYDRATGADDRGSSRSQRSGSVMTTPSWGEVPSRSPSPTAQRSAGDGRARITGHGRRNGSSSQWPLGLPANARFDTA